MSDVDTKKPDKRRGPGRPPGTRTKVILSPKKSELSSAAAATLDTPP